MPDILFPPGRMIGGNLDKLYPRTEANGQPKLGKDGNPEMECAFGVAIPKAGETAWQQTPWGATIYHTGAAAHPNLVASPSFSWKITDGDSTLPNKRGKRPCDQAGHVGNWVIWFKQGWLPKRCNADGSVELPDGSIVAGYYVQVFGSVAGNKLVPNGTPGVYLNPIAVALLGEGDKIATDVDTKAVGFGAAALPVGARPVAAVAPQFAAAPNAGGGYQAPAPASPATANVPPIVPNHAILSIPPAPPAGPQMTAEAAGVPYASFIAQGWTDDALRAQGYMQ